MEQSHQGHHTKDIPSLLFPGNDPKWQNDPKAAVTEILLWWVWCSIASLFTRCSSHTIWAWFCFFISLATIKNFTQAKIPAVTKNKETDKRISRKRRQAPVNTANHAKLHKISPTSRVNAKQNVQNHSPSIALFSESLQDFIISSLLPPPSQLPSSPNKKMLSPGKLFS